AGDPAGRGTAGGDDARAGSADDGARTVVAGDASGRATADEGARGAATGAGDAGRTPGGGTADDRGRTGQVTPGGAPDTSDEVGRAPARASDAPAAVPASERPAPAASDATPDRPAATSAGSAIAAPDPAPAAPVPGAAAAAADTEMLRRRWPDVLTTLRRLRVPSWALVNQHAQVLELDATTLRLGFLQPGLVTTFKNSGHGEVVARALHETLGVGVRVEAVLTEQGGAPARTSAAAAPAVPEVPTTISRERAAASWDLPAPPAHAAPEPAPPASGPRGDVPRATS
ncbi:hypothetical protein AB6N23_18485, partial [Cellulomonas sp. 179-A 9B4 NHS]